MFATNAWVAERLNSSTLRILDCSDLPTYRRGHLPGARHLWWQDTIETFNPVYGMLINAEGRAGIARRAGLEPDSEVACYDDQGGTFAARIAWTLRYMGHANVRLLPAGARGWRAEGHTLTREESASSGNGIADIFNESIIAHPQDILARLDEPNLVLLDTRTAAERSETWHGKLREGMLPDSTWLPRNRFIDEHNLPVQADVLLDRLADVVNLDTTAEFIVYGLHGTLAALPYHLLVALDRFQVRLYDGSWSQWGADESLPITPLNG